MASPIDTSSQTNEMLEQTELGHTIAKYKVPFIAIIALIIVGIIGYGFYTTQKEKTEQAYAVAIYQFDKSTFGDLTEGKLKIAPYLDKFNLLSKDVSYFKGLFPLLIKTVDHLISKKEYGTADTLLNEFKPHLDNSAMTFLVNSRHAVILENSGKAKEAIDVLEGMIKSGQKMMESKVYFDLGRLYLTVNDKQKAKTNLQYAIDNTTDDNLKKLAQVYLGEI